MSRPKYIRLTFTECGTAALAVLLWEQAPNTCEEVVKVLPSIGISHHAIYSGSECVYLLGSVIRVEKEHATSKVTKGQVGFTWLAAGSSYGVSEDFAEICWFYDIDAEPRMWEGPVEVNIFAEIRGPADDFYAVCRRMRRDGQKSLRVEVSSE